MEGMKMVQVWIRDDINDRMEEYVKEKNESGELLYTYMRKQFIAEAILEYMENHPIENKVKGEG